ncbi:MAG: response regulator transcription factor [Gammaproteobacteria bacterium]
MLTGLHVNIIGPQYLQNTLLASFLEEQTRVRCHVFDASKEVPKSLKHDTTPVLTLIDGNNDNQQYKPLEIFSFCRGQLGNQDLFAFYNAHKGSELEELAASLEIHGLFYGDVSQENLCKGIQAIYDGELWLPRRIIIEQLQRLKRNSKLFPGNGKSHNLLTAREIEILNLIATGAKNTDIASNLCLSVHTIKTHIYHIYKKIDVSNRMQAVNWASNNLQ